MEGHCVHNWLVTVLEASDWPTLKTGCCISCICSGMLKNEVLVGSFCKVGTREVLSHPKTLKAHKKVGGTQACNFSSSSSSFCIALYCLLVCISSLPLTPLFPRVYECNKLCKCNRNMCTNRLVQHGLQVRLQLFKTQNKGWGIRCLDDIAKGSFVCIYAGTMLSPCDSVSPLMEEGVLECVTPQAEPK